MRVKKWLAWASGLIVLFVLMIVIFTCYIPQGFCPSWMGFGSYSAPDGTYYPEKTLWDWLNLLIVPIVLGAGAYWFSSQDRKAEQRIERQRQQEQLVASYIDRMADLMLTHGLRTSFENLASEPSNVAQALTVTVLRSLDKEYQNRVLSFIRDSGLSQVFHGASLQSIQLCDVNLCLMDLSRVNLWRANLRGALIFNSRLELAVLYGADLSLADLSDSNMKWVKGKKANFTEADLRNADLSGADLREAIFTKAKLDGINLEGANLTDAMININQLVLAKSIDGAILPESLDRARSK